MLSMDAVSRWRPPRPTLLAATKAADSIHLRICPAHPADPLPRILIRACLARRGFVRFEKHTPVHLRSKVQRSLCYRFTSDVELAKRGRLDCDYVPG